MVRLVTCGWETGDINEAGNPPGGGGFSVASASPAPRTPSAYYIKSTQSLSSASLNFPLGANMSEIWVRFSFQWTEGGSGESGFFYVQDANGNYQGYLSVSNSDGYLRVYGNGVLGTSTSQFSQNAWHTVEVHWQILSATTGNVGVWVDGVQWFNFTGIDNTAQSNLILASVGLRCSGIYPGGITTMFDDLAVNDTTGATNNGQIGDGRVVLLVPNGAGSVTNQLRSGTDTGANWSQENEIPPSMSQYVYSAVPGTRDLYSMTDLPAGSWQVNSVDVIALAMLSDSTGGTLGLTLQSGGAISEGPAQNLTTSQQYLKQHYEVDPNTLAAWTTTAVNAVQAGTTVH
jgi:hypothetical protein